MSLALKNNVYTWSSYVSLIISVHNKGYGYAATHN